MSRISDSSFQEKHETLMIHVILPRYLPQCKPKDHHNEELALLSNMVENVDRLADWIPGNTVKMFRGLDRVHKTLKASNVSAEIDELEPGETFAMYVRRQNCALMIHMPPDGDGDRVIVSTFPTLLNPKIVYNAESDIEVRMDIKIMG